MSTGRQREDEAKGPPSKKAKTDPVPDADDTCPGWLLRKATGVVCLKKRQDGARLCKECQTFGTKGKYVTSDVLLCKSNMYVYPCIAEAFRVLLDQPVPSIPPHSSRQKWRRTGASHPGWFNRLKWPHTSSVKQGQLAFEGYFITNVELPSIQAMTSRGKFYMNKSNGLFYRPDDVQVATCGTIEVTHVPHSSVMEHGCEVTYAGRVRPTNRVQPQAHNELTVAFYIQAPFPNLHSWWTKPSWEARARSVEADWTWKTTFKNDGRDHLARRVRAYLLPRSMEPPKMAGATVWPPELSGHPFGEAELEGEE